MSAALSPCEPDHDAEVPSRAHAARAALAWLALAAPACTFDLNIKAARMDAGQMSVDAGESSADSGMNDAGAADAGHQPAAPIRHKACTMALPQELPALPRVLSDARGRPSFDFFRDVDCSTVTDFPTCDNLLLVDAESCVACVHGKAGDPGLCNPSLADTSDCEEPGFSVFVGLGGACRRCVSIKVKAKACCDGMPGVDCRKWPYPANSAAGGLCARHEDCQAGLVCKQGESVYGVCMCPESDPLKLVQPTGCVTEAMQP